MVLNNSNKNRRIILYGVVLVFSLPFLLGIVSLFSVFFGITPTWDVVRLQASFHAFTNALYTKQFFYCLLRANLIALALLVLVFFFGYLLCVHSRSKMLRSCVFFLAIPHVSLAVGFSFLVMPSGFLFRILAFFTGVQEVGDFTSTNDAYGISMSVVILIKLASFLMFMMLSTFQDYHLQYQILQSKILGHNKLRSWTFIVFPQLLPKIFVPFLISVAYALAPIDISLILGPRFPSSFDVIIQELLRGVSRDRFIEGHALSLLLGVGTLFSFAFWYGVFHALKKILRKGYVQASRFCTSYKKVQLVASSGFGLFTTIVLVSALLLFLWCCVIRWDFPSLLPSKIGILNQLSYVGRFSRSLSNTLLVATCSTVLSTGITMLVLELLRSLHWRRQFFVLGLLLLPLLIPSLIYITGVHVFFLFLGINGTFFAMVWAHSLRVAPYIMLLLYGVIKTYNDSNISQAKILGKSYLNALFRIKIPMLITPISYAMLIGMLVSIAEYVSTQFIGEGRWETATLLSVVLHSGANRQLESISGTLLILLNLLVLFLTFFCGRLQKGVRKVYL